MSGQKIHRASEAFYDRVEAALKEMGLSTNLSKVECEHIDDFANLDFGAGPCAQYIKQQRAKNESGNLSSSPT